MRLWPWRRHRDEPAPAAEPSPLSVEPEVVRDELPGDAVRAAPRVAALLAGAGVSGFAFVVLYVVDPNTQLLGVSLAAALALIAGALIVAGRRLVPQETAVEDRALRPHPDDRERVGELIAHSGAALSRRKLLGGAAGFAAAGVAAAAAVPIASLGPDASGRLGESPWRRGLALVDEHGRLLAADDLAIGAFTTAFPHGADPRELGSPVVVVRLAERQLHLPPQRASWAVEGIVAYSKICTHAGCAIALYRSPLDQRTTGQRPGLICPCHYSTFDPARAAKVDFGPAGRPLPQLPLMLGPGRKLVAAGPMSGGVGPAWWGIRR